MTDRLAALKFAVFTLVCLAFTAWIVSVVGNISLEDRVAYEAEFADVQGLLVNDDVKVSGVTVGKVTSMEVQPGGMALIGFEVRDDVTLREDAQIFVRWRDVFGLRFLYVDPGTAAPIEEGHRFPSGQTAAPVDLNVLLQRLVPVMSALEPRLQNQVLQALSEALVGQEEEVRSLIRQGASLTQTIADREEEVSRLLTNAATLMDAYAAREDQLRGLIDSFADVSTTVADRNDTLETAIHRIAGAQEELNRLLEANDVELRGALDEADAITQVLSVNREHLDDLLRTSGRALVSYHLISRIGQWFNIRAVGVSEDYQTIITERSASLPEQRYDHHSGPDGGDALRSFFPVPGGVS